MFFKKALWSQERYSEAWRFAAEVHNHQQLPGSDLPYLTHIGWVTMEVTAILSVEHVHDPNLAIQCALLHDVIEDTATTYDHLRQNFGVNVANGVLALSKDPGIEKELQLQDSLNRIRQQPREIWMVKLADRIANLQPPPSHWNTDKIKKYGDEAQVIYDLLKEGSPLLSERLLDKIQNYQRHCL
ncbi:HD domain-containing protein [Deltaproteobacteria bacterium TL4]